MNQREVRIPEVVPPRPLTLAEVLEHDLVTTCPTGFELLPVRQAALVRHRALHPGAMWRDSLLAVGFSRGQASRGRAQLTAAGALYLRALAMSDAQKVAEAPDPVGLRAKILARVSIELTSPDPRVALAAAKLAGELLPPAPAEDTETAKLSGVELEARVQAAAERAAEHHLAYEQAARRLLAMGCSEPALPGGDGEILRLLTNRGPGPLDGEDDPPEGGDNGGGA